MTADYLAGLDEIDWSSLTDAYGTAEKVPVGLRVLATGTPEEAAVSLGAFYGSICHQGSVYDSTLAAVPFLAEIAIDPQVAVRDGVIELLVEIMNGVFMFVDVADYFADPPGALARGAELGVTVEPQCRAAVRDAAPRIIDAMAWAPPAAQIWTCSLVADLAEAYDDLMPRLEPNAGQITDPWVGLALELLRACVVPGPRPEAAAAAEAMSPPPDAHEADQRLVEQVLRQVAEHLTEVRDVITTGSLLTRYAQHVPRVIYAPSWRDWQ